MGTPRRPVSDALGAAALGLALLVAGAAPGPARASEPAAIQDAAPAPTAGPAAGPSEATVEAVRDKVDELYRALWKSVEGQPTPDFATRYAILEPAVLDSYDLPFMSAKVLGRHWKKLSDEEKRRWIDVFSRLTIHTYAERFDADSGQRYEVQGVGDGGHDTLLVYSRILVPDEDPVEINYRLHQRGERWGIVDVYLNGTVSELALRRSEYSTVLKRDGFDALVVRLEEKMAEVTASASMP